MRQYLLCHVGYVYSSELEMLSIGLYSSSTSHVGYGMVSEKQCSCVVFCVVMLSETV